MSLHYTTAEADLMQQSLQDLGRKLHAAAAEGIRRKLQSGEWLYINGRYVDGPKKGATAAGDAAAR